MTRAQLILLAGMDGTGELFAPLLELQANPREAARHIRAFVEAHVPQVAASP